MRDNYGRLRYIILHALIVSVHKPIVYLLNPISRTGSRISITRADVAPRLDQIHDHVLVRRAANMYTRLRVPMENLLISRELYSGLTSSTFTTRNQLINYVIH